MIVLLGAILAGSVTLDGQPTSCRERFEKEAPPAWQRLTDSTRSVAGAENEAFDGESTDRTAANYGVPISRKEHRQFWLTGAARKVVVDRYEAGKWEGRSVYCANPDYAFVASQAVEGGPYFLKKYGSDKDTVNLVGHYFAAHGASDLRIAYAAEGDWRTMPELVHAADFLLTSCKQLEGSERSLVEVSYRFHPPPRPGWNRVPPSEEATAVFDPTADWRLVRAKVRSAEGVTGELLLSYAPDPAHLGSVTKLVRHITGPTGKATIVIDAISYFYAPIPPGEFRLNSVGLPEIDSANAGRNWRLILIAATLIAMGFLFYAFYRRGSRRNAAA